MGQCPVEHREEILSVHPSIFPYVPFPPGADSGWLRLHRGRIRLAQATQRQVQAGSGHSEPGQGYLGASWGYLLRDLGRQKEGWTDGWMDVWRDGISPSCSTGHHPLLGPLPCLHRALTKPLIAGQGYRWPLDAFGWLVTHHIKFSVISRDEPWFLCLMMILIATNLIQLQFPYFRGQPLKTKLNSLIMTASQNQSHKGKRFSLVYCLW